MVVHHGGEAGEEVDVLGVNLSLSSQQLGQRLLFQTLECGTSCDGQHFPKKKIYLNQTWLKEDDYP